MRQLALLIGLSVPSMATAQDHTRSAAEVHFLGGVALGRLAQSIEHGAHGFGATFTTGLEYAPSARFAVGLLAHFTQAQSISHVGLFAIGAVAIHAGAAMLQLRAGPGLILEPEGCDWGGAQYLEARIAAPSRGAHATLADFQGCAHQDRFGETASISLSWRVLRHFRFGPEVGWMGAWGASESFSTWSGGAAFAITW